MFDRYTRHDFADVALLHQQRTTGVVIGPMLVELITAVLLIVYRPMGVPTWAIWTGLALVIVWAAATAWLSVPMHKTLAAGFDETAHRKLITTNFLRTFAWTARGVLVAIMLLQRMTSSP